MQERGDRRRIFVRSGQGFWDSAEYALDCHETWSAILCCWLTCRVFLNLHHKRVFRQGLSFVAFLFEKTEIEKTERK